MDKKSNTEAIIKLEFVTQSKADILFKKLTIDSIEYKLNEQNLIAIQLNDYENELGSKIVTACFDSELSYFEAVPGENYGILFPCLGRTRDIIFNDDSEHSIRIEYKEKKIYEKTVTKRFLLLNLNDNYQLYIDDVLFTRSFIRISTNDSTQIILCDVENRIMLHKDISPIQYDEFMNFYNNNIDEVDKIMNDITKLLKNTNILDYELFIKQKLKNKDLTKLCCIKMNFSKSLKKKYYNKEKYFEFICNCSLYYILYSLKDKIVSSEEVLCIFNSFNKFKEKIKADSDLEFYNKNVAIIGFSEWIAKLEGVKEFEKINFKYYILEK